MNSHLSSVALGNATRKRRFGATCALFGVAAPVVCSTVRISPLTRPHFASLSLFCRLALYVYEYLLHVGAQKSAQTFLSEVRHCFPSTSCF